MNQEHSFNNLISLIQQDVTLTEEIKKKYIEAIKNLAEGKAIEPDTSLSLMEYLEDVYTEAERNALRAGDVDLINELAEARVERDTIVSLIVGSGVDGITEDSTANDKKAMDDVLQKIHTAANSAPVAVAR
ncbi:hypothetical protein CO165_02345 [Candidatus Roizmanbacteria bacterium CG_4_9_14_3_um_filter_33_18]|uniref:Uncharacterized protein n=1 Tax=Candidatus Roizmanbacteria bacterium CG_4_9_14_3_um_filter_33_18 TaxID=1974841 RepID=A0A2M7XY56_9BACT|nr:MAG: hypothetical protein CO165_02345 [Candidatus Roizmanbacteria bacterium CG_4_9_14_3_um_filter_33_18]